MGVTIGHVHSWKPRKDSAPAALDQARIRRPNSVMKRKPQTIVLTLRARPRRHQAGQDSRTLFSWDRGPDRRATLVVRPDEPAWDLRPRVMDSIVRLAGGPVVGGQDLADRIVDNLHHAPESSPASPAWTLEHLEDDSAFDPYAPLLPRLILVDSPTHRPTNTQRGTGRRRSIKPVTHSEKPLAAYSLQ